MHKQTRFLPPTKTETDQYALKPESKVFESYESVNFLRVLREKMAGSASGNSVPKAPSPFGRVWQYRRSLAGDLGEQRQKEAVSSFRGIMSLLALSDFYHLPVIINVSPQLKGAQTILQQLFSPHLACTPKSEAIDCLPFLWNERMVYFALRADSGDDVPFAGYSPLTLIYPAAKVLPDTLANQIFWWDRSAHRFDDPTSLPTIHPSSKEAKRIRPVIKAWLSHVVANIRDLKLGASDFQLVTQILKNWLQDLAPDKAAEVTIEIAQPSKGKQLMDDEAQLEALPVPPVFTWRVKTDHVTDVPSKPSRKTQRETLIISLAQIRSSDVKVYGAIQGSVDLERKLKSAPAYGDDLGKVVGQPAPVPYVILDHLVEQRLTKVYEDVKGISPKISDGWNALVHEGEVFLYPFKKEILSYFSPAEIAASASLIDAATSLTFEFKWEGVTFHKHYLASDRPLLDNSMDLRLFPNFAIDTLGHVEQLLPKVEDCRYYARLRLFPEKDDGSTMRWLNEAGRDVDQDNYALGNFEKGVGHSSPGKQRFWIINNAHNSENRPCVFHVPNGGLLIVRLTPKNFNDEKPMPWKVGLDFGTSNTCLVRRKQHDEEPEILHLPVFTTSLLEKWDVDRARSNAAEGYSAMFDFPYHNKNFGARAKRLGISDVQLNPKNFFPTQVVHHENKVAPPANAPAFELKNGLAIFQNITVASLLGSQVSELLKGFDALKPTPSNGAETPPVRFILNRALKWEESNPSTHTNLAWRRVFHQHLRLHIIMAAAFENATIDTLRASYPKAFTDSQEKNYKKLLNEIWTTEARSDSGSSVKVDISLSSESAAAASHFKVRNAQVFYLVDIGGGTSDIAIYSNKGLVGECSLKLAGGCFENYFCRSLKYRETVAAKRGKHSEFNELHPSRVTDFDRCLKSATSSDDSSNAMFRTAFHGILNIIDPGSLIDDAIEVKDKACTGFILTNVILYGGLAYFVGLMQHESELPDATDYTIQWVGNGSCFLRAFNSEREPARFENVLSEMFKAASQSQRPPACRSMTDAKEIVALGLLTDADVQDGFAPNIASKLFSNSLLSKAENSGSSPNMLNAEFTSASTLVDFYAQPKIAHFEWDGLVEGNFRSFLEALQLALPQFMIGASQGVLGNLAAIGITQSSNWAVEYVTLRKSNIARLFRERLMGNHSIWNQIAKDTPTKLQVEPIFITEIAALIDDIREFCGEGKV